MEHNVSAPRTTWNLNEKGRKIEESNLGQKMAFLHLPLCCDLTRKLWVKFFVSKFLNFSMSHGASKKAFSTPV